MKRNWCTGVGLGVVWSGSGVGVRLLSLCCSVSEGCFHGRKFPWVLSVLAAGALLEVPPFHRLFSRLPSPPRTPPPESRCCSEVSRNSREARLVASPTCWDPPPGSSSLKSIWKSLPCNTNGLVRGIEIAAKSLPRVG